MLHELADVKDFEEYRVSPPQLLATDLCVDPRLEKPPGVAETMAPQ